MTYNAANRLTGYEKEKDGTALLNQKNRYNGEGQRIRKEETKGAESSVRNYYYQDDSLLYTMDEDEQMDTVNLVGLDGEIMFTVAAVSYTHLQYRKRDYGRERRGDHSGGAGWNGKPAERRQPEAVPDRDRNERREDTGTGRVRPDSADGSAAVSYTHL